MTHPDALTIPRAVVGQSIPGWREQCSETTTLGAQLVLMQAEIDALRAALQPQAAEGCGEAGCAEGCCGNAQCLPSFKAKKAAAEPVAWPDWRRTLAERVDAYIQMQSENDNDEELTAAYNALKAHIVSTPFATPPATQAALTAALSAMQDFCAKCDMWLAKSIDSYGKFKAAIAQIEALKGPTQ